ncbi:MAG: hypothetical protein IJJ64_05440 [Butyrivibrio sp.]|nr:hypothetical protein [Butyrivibrio sp.]
MQSKEKDESTKMELFSMLAQWESEHKTNRRVYPITKQIWPKELGYGRTMGKGENDGRD